MTKRVIKTSKEDVVCEGDDMISNEWFKSPIEPKQQLTTLQAYHLACNELLSDFIKTYFCDDDIRFDSINHWWIGGNIGGVVCIHDYYFNMSDIADAIECMVDKESLFEWYEQWTEPTKDSRRINLKSWVLLTKEFPK